MIRDATISDAPAMVAIFNHYVEHTTATLVEQPMSLDDMEHALSPDAGKSPWIVMEQSSEIAGYAYASRWRTQSAYRHTREATVYLDPKKTGQGHGSALYQQLLTRLRAEQIHCVIGVLSLPNPASVRLHESLGFTHVATFPQVGYKFGQWVDVGYWQLTFPNDKGDSFYAVGDSWSDEAS